MNFPEYRNPNRLLWATISCLGAFLLPFALRSGSGFAILAAAVCVTSYLAVGYWFAWKNNQTNLRWMQENGIFEISSREALNRLEYYEPNEARLIVAYDDWPFQYATLNPKVVLVEKSGSCFWIRWRFIPQAFRLLSVARRRAINVSEISTHRQTVSS